MSRARVDKGFAQQNLMRADPAKGIGKSTRRDSAVSQADHTTIYVCSCDRVPDRVRDLPIRRPLYEQKSYGWPSITGRADYAYAAPQRLYKLREWPQGGGNPSKFSSPLAELLQILQGGLKFY